MMSWGNEQEVLVLEAWARPVLPAGSVRKSRALSLSCKGHIQNSFRLKGNSLPAAFFLQKKEAGPLGSCFQFWRQPAPPQKALLWFAYGGHGRKFLIMEEFTICLIKILHCKFYQTAITTKGIRGEK